MTARLPFELYAGVAASGAWGETRRPNESGDDLTEPATKVPGPIAALRFGYGRASGPFFTELNAVFQLPQSRLSEGDELDVRLCAAPQRCDQVDGYVNVALRAGLRLDRFIALTLVADNLLDVAYKTYAAGAYAPGRNLILGLRGSI